MNKINAVLIPFFLAAPLAAAVPNQITYQGRLTKSGISSAGSHTFVACLTNGASNLWCDPGQTLNLPVSGDFTLILQPTVPVDWINNAVKLKLTVDGQLLTPPDNFTSVPYALIAATATAVQANAVHLQNTNQTIDSWQSVGQPGLIDATKLDGSVPGEWIKELDGRLHYAGGNVGIGTSTTTDILSVAGSVYFTGDLDSDGGFVIRDKTAGQDRITVSDAGPVTIHNGLSMNGTKITTLATATNPDEAVRFDQLSSALPPGVVLPFAGPASSVPAGYLFCDGSAVNRTGVTANLFAVIGTTFGPGDGATTFNLPDIRGIFPKGAGTTNRPAGVDASGNSYAATLGTYSQDKMQGVAHSFANTANGNLSTNTNLVGGVAGAVRVDASGAILSLTHVSDGTNGTPRTGHTTEPQSLGLNYIIKF